MPHPYRPYPCGVDPPPATGGPDLCHSLSRIGGVKLGVPRGAPVHGQSRIVCDGDGEPERSAELGDGLKERAADRFRFLVREADVHDEESAGGEDKVGGEGGDDGG